MSNRDPQPTPQQILAMSPAEVEQGLRSEGIDPIALDQRFTAKLRELLAQPVDAGEADPTEGIQRRTRAKEAYDKLKQIAEAFRRNLDREALRYQLVQIRAGTTAMPAQAMVAFRKLESGEAASDEEILLDLLTLAKVFENVGNGEE